MKLLKKIIDLILYSNLWIALCATAMALQSQIILLPNLEWNPLIGFIFCSTLFLYAIHRIVGIVKVKDFLDDERFTVIASYKNHIIFYAFIAGIGSIYFFFCLTYKLWIAMVFPSLISLAYVLPIFGKQRRLRDFSHIKIYLIAISWAWITVFLVAINANINWKPIPILLLFLERILFVFAITIPFDIRDLKVDKHNVVKTIPLQLGTNKSIYLAIGSLILAFLFAYINLNEGIYSTKIMTGLGISYLVSMLLIYLSKKIHHDYFYTGGIDGLMLLQFMLVYILQ